MKVCPMILRFCSGSLTPCSRPGKRVVISHHAPVVNPNTQHGNSPYMPAYNSLDMLPIIETWRKQATVTQEMHVPGGGAARVEAR